MERRYFIDSKQFYLLVWFHDANLDRYGNCFPGGITYKNWCDIGSQTSSEKVDAHFISYLKHQMSMSLSSIHYLPDWYGQHVHLHYLGTMQLIRVCLPMRIHGVFLRPRLIYINSLCGPGVCFCLIVSCFSLTGLISHRSCEWGRAHTLGWQYHQADALLCTRHTTT
jgi:hypothetical protein